MKAYYCDVCHKRILKPYDEYNFSLHLSKDYEGDNWHKLLICDKCAEEVVKTLERIRSNAD